jgi:hypothetical protein
VVIIVVVAVFLVVIVFIVVVLSDGSIPSVECEPMDRWSSVKLFFGTDV